MSYCRWSSDDFQCDVYCYENVSGVWTTHVAGRRRKYLAPLPPKVDFLHEEYFERFRVVMDQIPYEWVDIDLPYAGETFDDPSPGAMRDRLLMLRDIGYNVPQYAIDELEEEMKDGESTEAAD